MTAPQLTPSEVAAMQERCDRATAGPWFQCDPPWGDGLSVHNRSHDPHGATEIICVGETFEWEEPPDGFHTLENMDFIAHARTDMPRLLADRRAMDEECRKLQRDNDRLHNLALDYSNKIREWQELTGCSHPSACQTKIETLLAAKGGEDGT